MNQCPRCHGPVVTGGCLHCAGELPLPPEQAAELAAAVEDDDGAEAGLKRRIEREWKRLCVGAPAGSRVLRSRLETRPHDAERLKSRFRGSVYEWKATGEWSWDGYGNGAAAMIAACAPCRLD